MVVTETTREVATSGIVISPETIKYMKMSLDKVLPEDIKLLVNHQREAKKNGFVFPDFLRVTGKMNPMPAPGTLVVFVGEEVGIYYKDGTLMAVGIKSHENSSFEIKTPILSVLWNESAGAVEEVAYRAFLDKSELADNEEVKTYKAISCFMTGAYTNFDRLGVPIEVDFWSDPD